MISQRRAARVQMIKKKTPVAALETTPGDQAHLDADFRTFLDDGRKSFRNRPTMLSNVNRAGELAAGTVSCFWCRHRFDSDPVGCPLMYVPAQISRTLVTQTRETYTISENVSESDVDVGTLQSREYFETDGVFCSYPCCLAYIQDNRHNPLYAQSKTLLHIMAQQAGCGRPLTAAPSWRMLQEYGGPLSIDEFRKRHENYTYTQSHEIHKIPMHPVSVMFEERRHL